MKHCIGLEDCVRAYARLASKAHRTPILQATSLPTGPYDRVVFKCENMQKTGSFKFRGATNAVAVLKEKRESGSAGGATSVVTHSSGNHGQALALAARELNIPAHIVMPSNSPACKVAAVKSYGANVIFCDPNDKARTDTAEKVASENNGLIIHPNQDPDVMAGQASIAMEIIDQMRDTPPDAVLIPVGGGGMISGMAMYLKSVNPSIRVIGVEPLMANDCALSKRAGKLIPNASYPNTIADGVRTSIGENAWPIIRDLVDDVFELTEEEIIEGWRLGMERLKVVLEPTAGLGVAAITSPKFHEKYPDFKTVAVVLCGGNVDIPKISQFFEQK